MTLVVAWIGTDDTKNGKAISSLYIGSDSRYSWLKDKFNGGQKVFCSTKYPEIFGFCGDVVYPLNAINHILTQIDKDLLFETNESFISKKNKILNVLHILLSEYPVVELSKGFTILYGTKIKNEFKLFKFVYNKSNHTISESEIVLPNISTKVFAGGSGEKEFKDNWIKCDAEKDNNKNTTRQVYHCMSETIKHIKDPATGGIPQVVGIYRGLGARIFGIIENNERYISGLKVSEDIHLDNLEWRNSNFERVDPITKKLKEGAQAQPF